MYSEQDLINIFAIYQNYCNGDIKQTREAYRALYGVRPSMYTVKKAINFASTRAQQLEQKPAAANNNKVIDCKFLEDSFEIKEEVITTDEEDDNPNNSKQHLLYTGTNVIKEELSEASTTVDSKLHQVPVVYTTRLNDMNILKKDLNSLTVDSIMQSVIAESIPQLKQKSQVKSEIFTNNSLSFDELLEKVELYNLFATSIDFGDFKITVNSTFNDSFDHQSCDDEASEKELIDVCTPHQSCDDEASEKEPLDVCTPLSIVLTDCKIECRNCYVKVKSMRPMVFKFVKCRNCNPEIDYHNNKKVKNNSSILIRREFDSETKWINQIISNIVMKNLYSNTIDIYCIRSRTAILYGYFFINHAIGHDKELLKFIHGNAITEYINCCWVNRNTKCKKLWSKYECFDINIPPLFLLDSHPCPHNLCNCCCRDRNSQGNIISENNSTSIKVSSEKLYKSQSIRSQLLSITNCVETDTWINKALKYSKKLKPKVTAEDVKPASIRGGFAVQIESSKYLEHYTVQNGKIHSYYEIDRQSSKPYQSQINSHENVLKGSGCCWFSREIFVSKKFKNCLIVNYHFAKTTHNILNFFKTPHQCPIGSCRCCCKVPNFKYTYTDKSIEEIEKILIKKSSNYKSKHVQNLKLYKKLTRPNINKLQNKTDVPKKQPKSNERKNQTGKTSNPYRSRLAPRIWPRPILSVPLLPQQIEDVVLTNNKPLTSIQNPDILDPATNNATIQDPLVKTLIENVLERFKNIRLNLNSEGKVVAELDTPATNLSKVELEILSNILTHAQQQVDNLGMANHVTENLQTGIDMSNTLLFIPSALKNTNTLFLNEAALAKQNPSYNNITTNENVTTNIPFSVNQQKSTSLLKEREKMESTVGSSTDLYHAYTTLSYLKSEQYRHSFIESTHKKHVQCKSSYESQNINEATEPPNPLGLKITNGSCLTKNDKVAAEVRPTNLATLNYRAKRKSEMNSNFKRTKNNLGAKKMRMILPTPVTGDISSQTLPLMKIVPYMQPSPIRDGVDNKSNFSQPFVVFSSIPAMAQPIFTPADYVLSTEPPIAEPLFRENSLLAGLLSTPQAMMFNGTQGASSSVIINAENDEDDCILGV